MSKPDAPSPRRDDFAATVLEFGPVLEVLERHISSSLGQRALRQLEPRDEAGARAALARCGEALRLVKASAEPSLAGFTDPLPEDKTGAPRALDEERFLALHGFCQAAARVGQWLQEHAEELPALAELSEGLPDLLPLAERIEAVLDPRGKVRDEASPLLARLRGDVQRVSAQIERTVRDILQRPDVRLALSDGSVHRRAGRPVLAVKAKSAGRVPGIVHDRSQSEASVFVEPRAVIEPGNRLAEARADERREVERVLLALTQTVRAASAPLREAATRLGELELAITSARWAREAGALPAALFDESVAGQGRMELVLRRARHPLLLEQKRLGRLDDVVPIDVRLGVEFDMLIITGPNTGGKTLALKTVGLFALMTRCGLPVPAAEGTIVPFFEGVLADIGDEQEISQNLSTFASHLVRIRGALEHAGPRTLVLLDELGGGTDPDEGAALGAAVLDALLERGVPTLVSTHIGKLKEFAFRRPRAENACTEFDLATLAPRYTLLVGTPGESGALVIARRLGLPESVVALAERRMERRAGEVAEMMADLRTTRAEAEEARTRAEGEHETAQRAREGLVEKRQELERRSELLVVEAQRGLEERVRDGMREVAACRSLLEQLPRAAAEALRARLVALEAHLSGATLTERREAFLQGLGKGSFVYLPRYRQRVVVQKVDRAKREVAVRLGKMNMRVSFDEVTLYEAM